MIMTELCIATVINATHSDDLKVDVKCERSKSLKIVKYNFWKSMILITPSERPCLVFNLNITDM